MKRQVRTTKEGDRIMWKKKKEEKEEKEEDLLKELCRDDEGLFDFLKGYMYVDPLAAVSKESLEILIKEAEKSGNYRQAVDKAIFEATQNPGKRRRYIKVIQYLASKTIHATEQEIEKAEKERLTDWAASLERRIENQKFMSERTEDIVNVASEFYKEKLVELGENVRREVRKEARREAEREEKRIEERERAGRETRKKAELDFKLSLFRFCYLLGCSDCFAKSKASSALIHNPQYVRTYFQITSFGVRATLPKESQLIILKSLMNKGFKQYVDIHNTGVHAYAVSFSPSAQSGTFMRLFDHIYLSG